jgi:hypothetical protein
MGSKESGESNGIAEVVWMLLDSRVGKEEEVVCVGEGLVAPCIDVLEADIGYVSGNVDGIVVSIGKNVVLDDIDSIGNGNEGDDEVVGSPSPINVEVVTTTVTRFCLASYLKVNRSLSSKSKA